MEFGLSQEQEMLQQSVGGYLQDNGGLDRARKFADDGESRADDVWAGLCELGVPGLIIDEEYDGLGLSLLDAALVAETLGYNVTPVPFVSTVIMAPMAIALAGSDEQKTQWLPKLADGSVIAGAALTEVIGARSDAGVTSDGSTLNGKALFVLDFEADVYLVADADRNLYLVDAKAKGLERNLLTTVDKTRPVGELVFNNVAAEAFPNASGEDVCARIIDAGRIILAADNLGAAQNMLDQAVAYSKIREQFGRVIGSFQAVKHMCAEMASDLEPCRAMMWYAAHAFDTAPEESSLLACHTKAHLAEVATSVGKTATEVHGGVGFTDELGLHYWFKRIGFDRQMLGGPTVVREEAARIQQLV
ncbi:MAG: acyl-CoA dehydrogenase family protein [Candidatus Hydrogenedentota bacterium]